MTVTVADVAAFLRGVHREDVADIEQLAGGFWSAAFAYRARGRELVLRVGLMREGFDMDRAAMAFAAPDLPVPEVLEVGDAFGQAYAISARHRGRFLETVDASEGVPLGGALDGLLRARRRVQGDPAAGVSWYEPESSMTWREWVLAGLVDHAGGLVSGWRARLAADGDLDRLFSACEERVHDLVGACPERRDLVHADLLNRNVLVSDDASRVTAVFSWKCSTFGDFLYDVAWCTFWSDWHPGIAATDVWGRIWRGCEPADLVDAPLRHHAYELQIGASHLGWHAWTGDEAGLQAVAARTAHTLERGPLVPPPD